MCPSQGEHTPLPAAALGDRGQKETAQPPATLTETQGNALLEKNTKPKCLLGVTRASRGLVINLQC